jgi:hypothetical protein
MLGAVHIRLCLASLVQPHPTPSLYRRSLHRREGTTLFSLSLKVL